MSVLALIISIIALSLRPVYLERSGCLRSCSIWLMVRTCGRSLGICRGPTFSAGFLSRWPEDTRYLWNPLTETTFLLADLAVRPLSLRLVMKELMCEERTPAGNRRTVVLSAVFLVVLAITFSIASWDWLMSLEAHWFSTIFAAYHFTGAFVSGLAMITVAAIVLRRRGSLEGIVSDAHLQDMGKLILGLSSFWAYLWLCQYLFGPSLCEPFINQALERDQQAQPDEGPRGQYGDQHAGKIFTERKGQVTGRFSKHQVGLIKKSTLANQFPHATQGDQDQGKANAEITG